LIDGRDRGYLANPLYLRLLNLARAARKYHGDLAVLDCDCSTVPAEDLIRDLRRTRSLLAIVGGRILRDDSV